MKFKFNIRLTTSLVSLFIALVLVFFSGKSIYATAFALIFLGAAAGLCAFWQQEILTQFKKDFEEETYEDEELSEAESIETIRSKNKCIKKKNRSIVIFYVGAALFIIMGFVLMF